MRHRSKLQGFINSDGSASYSGRLISGNPLDRSLGGRKRQREKFQCPSRETNLNTQTHSPSLYYLSYTAYFEDVRSSKLKFSKQLYSILHLLCASIVCSLIKLNATVPSRRPAGTAIILVS